MRPASVLGIDLFVCVVLLICIGTVFLCLLHKVCSVRVTQQIFLAQEVYRTSIWRHVPLCMVYLETRSVMCGIFGDTFRDVWYISKLTDERSFFQNVIDACF
jgi:hypothetical protein